MRIREFIQRLALAAAATAALASSAFAAEVTTDLADYAPGSTAQITGSGFGSVELVTLQVIHVTEAGATSDGHEPWDVITDESGSFSTSWYVNPDDSANATLLLTADSVSGFHAEVTFTDTLWGSGYVSDVVGQSGACVVRSGNANNVASWDVVQGETYTVTLSGVEGSFGSSMSVMVKSSNDGNRCFTATGGNGTYSFDITMLETSCHTYPIQYGGSDCDPNTYRAARKDPGVETAVHLRAANFNDACQLLAGDSGKDLDCSAPEPVINCDCHIVAPTNIEVSADANLCTKSGIDLGTATLSGSGCDGWTITNDAGTVFQKGTTTITWSATKAGCNETTTSAQTVTVNDTQPPNIKADPVVQANDAGSCSAIVTYVVTPSDNCDGANVDVSCSPLSGTEFSVGTTTVTCTATDSSNNTGTKSFTVTVNDTQAPVVTVPADIVVGNTPGLCGRSVTYSASANDNCPGVGAATCQPASGFQFDVGVHDVTCSATDAHGNTGTATFHVTVNDTEAPVFTDVPANIVVNHAPGACNAQVSWVAAARDNCGNAVITSTSTNGGSFNVGTTPVTLTVTDGAGNTATYSFSVTVRASICGVKSYDDEANGDASGDVGINGWKVQLLNGNTVMDTNYTANIDGVNGSYCFNVQPGTYTVREVMPNSNWLTTGVTTQSVTVSSASCMGTANFTNLCLGAGGGLTLGYWSNKNGQATMNDGGTLQPELAILNADCLANATGNQGDFANYNAFRSWLLSATATNMSYMLSAQLAAMEMNVESGRVSDSTLVHAGDCGNTGAFGEFISIGDLRAAAKQALCDDAYTPDGDPNRAEWECLKNALDKANNNRNFVQGTACTFVYP